MKRKILLLFTSLMIITLTFNVNKIKATDFDTLAPYAICIEASTGNIIYQKNENEKIAPASMTKIMTMLIVLDSIENGVLSFDDVITASENAKKQGGSTIYLEVNEKMRVEDVFKGLVIASGNDCAVCLAEAICGTEENFVSKMNEYASNLGLKNTNFVNSNGLPNSNHYSTVYDIAIIARTLLLKHEKTLTKYTKIYEDYLRKDTKPFWLVNTNKLVKYYDDIDGLKTGYDGKYYSLCLTSKRNNTRMISVVSGLTDPSKRNLESIKILNYAYNNYELLTIINKDTIIKTIEDIKTKPNIYHITTNETISVLKKKTEKDELYTYKLDIDNMKIYVYYNNELLKEYPLSTKENIAPATFLDILKYVLKTIFY